ncbi:unnamed protein product [Caenorhabditis bovis]|uniref:Disease resistance R13L4/SHOC-2-like LRR domain-containing protein n=1 Tax=Caenorhabditis bovis TaxID=2654633 RepID=A0A8S1EPD1_9PELO|nr:unnamed protein product [Caenorhabditis bovis]
MSSEPSTSDSPSVFLNNVHNVRNPWLGRRRIADNYYPNGSTRTDELILHDYGLEEIPLRYQEVNQEENYNPENIRNLTLTKNSFVSLRGLSTFTNVVHIDISNNSLTSIPEDIGNLSHLTTLVARNNLLETLPKSMCTLSNMEAVYLSGNRIDSFPAVVFNMHKLKVLHMGGNQIDSIPFAIGSMRSLEILYLGGNRITEVPATTGLLRNLTALSLSDNRLETIPSTLGELHHLESLTLHNNKLTTLPTEIIKLQNLRQLSLRHNPLVNNFVHTMSFDPPSLKELAGRVVRLRMHKLPLTEVLPAELIDYLRSACQCVNPQCKGVYFEARVEHIKFVDFCGKYRVPLLQFLCSPGCSSGLPNVQYESSSESEEELFEPRLRKVLLG